MNNYRLLNIINPQFIYNIDCGQEENNNKYMIVIPAIVGYDKNVACSIYLTISEKLLDESLNMKLEKLINDMKDDITILFKGYDDFVPGVDYYLSESLYDYVLTFIPDDPDVPVIPPTPPDPDTPEGKPYVFDWTGIIILHGKDINRLMNINKYNVDRVYEIIALEEAEKKNRRKVLMMTKPDISAYLNDEEIDEIDEDLSSRIVMKDYVLYDHDLNFSQNTDAYKYLYDINNKDMRNLEWFYHMNNLKDYKYSREELCNISKTFFTIISNNAIVQNQETVNNQIYDKIVKYYANGGWDDASINLNLILNSTIPTTLPSTKLNCGCNGGSGNGLADGTVTALTSCVDMYKNAINEWLKKMLADDEFYKDWFFTIISGMCPTPNAEMIDSLIDLLTEYIDRNLGAGHVNGGQFDPKRRYDVFNHMNCCNDCSGNDAYKNIIFHYIEVLKVVKNNDIDANKNMIKIYGEEFAGILLYLTC